MPYCGQSFDDGDRFLPFLLYWKLNGGLSSLVGQSAAILRTVGKLKQTKCICPKLVDNCRSCHCKTVDSVQSTVVKSNQLSLWPITRDVNTAMNQSEFKAQYSRACI